MSEFTIQRRRTFGELPVDKVRSVETAATGTTYTALPNIAGARIVRFMAPSQDLELREVGGTATAPISAGTDTVVHVADNSNALEIRRLDTSNSQITVGLLIGVY